MSDVQISAYVSESAKEQMERYVAATGIKKGALIEQALLHHLQALRELPADIVIPARIVVSHEVFDQLTHAIQNPCPPTDAMLALMRGEGDDPPASSG